MSTNTTLLPSTVLPDVVVSTLTHWEEELQTLLSITTKYNSASAALCQQLDPSSQQLTESQREGICKYITPLLLPDPVDWSFTDKNIDDVFTSLDEVEVAHISPLASAQYSTD